ncbi:MAG: acylphosphatase [Beijerinckiaceae bacterium]|nr:acylphosphatase [Beijerinckiaceae bacterium]
MSGSNDGPDRTIRAFVHGRVQKVGYRAWVNAHAQALGLRGFVRNRQDGSVEAVFAGEPDAIARMAESLLRGPPKADVSGVQITEENESALEDTFGAHFVVLPTR